MSKLEIINNILTNHQYEEVIEGGHKMLIDGQTANIIKKVYDALSDENKEKYLSLSWEKMARFAWKAVA